MLHPTVTHLRRCGPGCEFTERSGGRVADGQERGGREALGPGGVVWGWDRALSPDFFYFGVKIVGFGAFWVVILILQPARDWIDRLWGQKIQEQGAAKESGR